MRCIGILIGCIVGIAGAGIAGAGIAGAGIGQAKPKPPARMLVYAQEWTMYGSRTSVPAGRVIVQLWNRGQDAHDLRIRRLNSRGQMVGGTQKLTLTQSGVISEANWKLRRGRYELYCSLWQHRQRGMHTRLTVR